MFKMFSRFENSRKRKLAVCLGLACVVLLAAGLFLHWRGTTASQTDGLDGNEWMETLTTASGQSRRVSTEEYEFFYKLVRRDSKNRGDEEALQEETKAFIRRQNAMFCAAEQAGLCEPFSYERMRQDMEQENARRAEMKAAGERIYGLEQFDLNSYYSYMSSNLELALQQYLAEQASDEMEEEARRYYREHLSDYQTINTATYQKEEDGAQETVTLSLFDMRTLINVNEELFEFLLTSEPGDRLTQTGSDGKEAVYVFQSRDVLTASFEDAYSTVMKDYIVNECYEDILSEVAIHNPVVFDQ